MSDRVNISSGSPFEATLGYSRAVKVGNQVWVAGTTAPGDDAAEQTREIFRRIGAALAEAGGSLENVVRSRVFLTDMADLDAIGVVHGEVFGVIRPAATMVEVSALAGPGLLVEIEVDAVL